MDLLQALYQRRSVRQYTDQPIARDTIDTLIQAAVQAPSAMNSQPWSFVILQGAAQLKALSDAAKAYLLTLLEQVPPLQKYKDALENPGYNIFYGTSTLVIICGSPASPHSVEDCSMAAQNLMLAAYGMGLGTCWIGLSTPVLNTPEWKDRLHIPAECQAIAPLIIGYPQQQQHRMARLAPIIHHWQSE